MTVLSDNGAPTPVAWTRLRAPRSPMAQIDPAAQQQAVAASPLQAKYGTAVDRESAYDKLAARLAPPPISGEPEPTSPPAAPSAPQSRSQARRPNQHRAIEEVLKSSAFKSLTRSAASVRGREITRSIFGTARRR